MWRECVKSGGVQSEHYIKITCVSLACMLYCSLSCALERVVESAVSGGNGRKEWRGSGVLQGAGKSRREIVCERKRKKEDKILTVWVAYIKRGKE